jgi:hypothetical protein
MKKKRLFFRIPKICWIFGVLVLCFLTIFLFYIEHLNRTFFATEFVVEPPLKCCTYNKYLDHDNRDVIHRSNTEIASKCSIGELDMSWSPVKEGCLFDASEEDLGVPVHVLVTSFERTASLKRSIASLLHHRPTNVYIHVAEFSDLKEETDIGIFLSMLEDTEVAKTKHVLLSPPFSKTLGMSRLLEDIPMNDIVFAFDADLVLLNDWR